MYGASAGYSKVRSLKEHSWCKVGIPVSIAGRLLTTDFHTDFQGVQGFLMFSMCCCFVNMQETNLDNFMAFCLCTCDELL